MDAIPLIAVVLSAGSAALFALVGRTIQRRPVSPDTRTAQTGFVTWWYGIASLSVVTLVSNFPGFPLDLRLFLLLTVVQLLVLCAALTGLIHYLVFLYTSRRNAVVYIAVGYALFFGLFLLFLAQSQPTEVVSTRWGPEMEYERTIDSGPLFIAMIVGLLGPPIVAAAAYLRLYRLVADPILKRRILLVSMSVLVWFGSSLIGTAPGAAEADWWRIASRLIGAAAAATILYAYTGLRPDGMGARDGAPRAKHDSFFDPPKGQANRVQRVQPIL